MQGFWKLTSIIISLTGFLITGGYLLYIGEELPGVIIRSVSVFAILFIVQNVLGGILSAVTGFGQEVTVEPVVEKENPEEQKPAPKKKKQEKS